MVYVVVCRGPNCRARGALPLRKRLVELLRHDADVRLLGYSCFGQCDDGPNVASTPRLLELLERYEVKATFFAIGRYAREQPALLREVAAAGHPVGNHTYTHVTMPLHSAETIRRELRRTDAAIVGKDRSSRPAPCPGGRARRSRLPRDPRGQARGGRARA